MGELAVLVTLACINQVACNDLVHAFYLHEPELQRTQEYTEQRLKQRFGEKNMLYSATMASVVLGNDFTAPVTTNLSFKGNLKWQNAGLSYSYYF